MSESRSPLVFLGDPRLAPHATGEYPAWLWSADATCILWSNAAAAAIFNADSPAALATHTIDAKGSAALQIARLAATLQHGAAPRLERLRGFGGRFGGALMCGCSRVTLADRTPAILVVATETAGPRLPLDERARRLLVGSEAPIALFAADGTLLQATAAAQKRLRRFTTLNALGAAALAATALTAGRAEGDVRIGKISLDRIGNGSSTVLMASFAPRPAEDAVPAQAKPADAKPAEATTVETTPVDATLVESALPAPPIDGSPAAPAAPVVTAEAPAPPKPDKPRPDKPTPAKPKPGAPPKSEPRRPLRFVWQMDDAHCFNVESEEFRGLLGPNTAQVLGRPWSEIAEVLGLDPDGQVARALASRETWSGITVAFPSDGTDARFAVEMSGLPVFDRDRSFRGYRGFGVCRDIARMSELSRGQRPETPPPVAPHAEPPVFREPPALSVVPPSENVVPFRASGPPEKPPTLTAVEHSAFSELASRLNAQLRAQDQPGAKDTAKDVAAAAPQPPGAPERPFEPAEPRDNADSRSMPLDQRPILDRLPVGVLVYRLDRLIYANRAFLDWTGYEQLSALEEAGGLDALFVEPAADELGANNGSKALTIATNKGSQLPVEARLFSSPWEGESALVLMLTGVGGDGRKFTAPVAGTGQPDDLRAILDATADGVVVLAHDRSVITANRGAETLFGYDRDEMTGLPFVSLIALDSQRAALQFIAAAQPKSESCELGGRRRNGSPIALSMLAGPIGGADEKLCVTFRDITEWKQAETGLLNAKRQAELASAAKSDFLARISHEIRTPLNAIIGFTEVMMQESFGPIGNDRYRQYLKDIRLSGSHLVALLNDLLDLSKIEAGKLDLTFASLDLNALTQECVSLMQPQAGRERIIIRTSLAADLPPVIADARSVRQIALNLLSNSIKFTGAGGQVIVSTAQGDEGGAVLRVRDTGTGMSEQDLAVALEPFRQLATAARWGSDGSGLGLPLTKALAEANRATFRIRSAVHSGTLVEIAFPGARLAAE